jgi:diguanylate cyclase (GGDEF)-like protein
VDYFKNYNDTYGHLTGDSVLKKVADTIKDTLRTADDIFRYGGEEIIVVLPEQDSTRSLWVAERLRIAVHNQCVEHKKSVYKVVTISCGVSLLNKDFKTWETTLELADQALYEAKKAGRNCSRLKDFPPILITSGDSSEIELIDNK